MTCDVDLLTTVLSADVDAFYFITVPGKRAKQEGAMCSISTLTNYCLFYFNVGIFTMAALQHRGATVLFTCCFSK